MLDDIRLLLAALRKVPYGYYVVSAGFLAVGVFLGIQNWNEAHYRFLKNFSGPFATVVAAAVAALIAWHFGATQAAIAQRQVDTAALQADLAQVRLQHDLYDRRYRLYEIAQSFLVQVVRTADVDIHSTAKFMHEVGEAVFLLDKSLVVYFDEVRKKAIRLEFLCKVIDTPGYADKRAAFIDEKVAIASWFGDQFAILVEKFKPFLVLDQHNLNASL
jgi:hypothetical protein